MQTGARKTAFHRFLDRAWMARPLTQCGREIVVTTVTLDVTDAPGHVHAAPFLVDLQQGVMPLHTRGDGGMAQCPCVQTVQPLPPPCLGEDLYRG